MRIVYHPINASISNYYETNQGLLIKECDKTYVAPFYSEKEKHQFENISGRLTREFREENEDKKRK